MCVRPVADSLPSRTIPFHSFLSGGLFSPPVHSPTDPQHFLARSICPLSPSLSAWLLAAVHPPPRYFAHYPPLLSPSRPLSWRLHTEAIGSHYVDGDDDSVEWRCALLPSAPPLQGLSSASSPPAGTQALIRSTRMDALALQPL